MLDLIRKFSLIKDNKRILSVIPMDSLDLKKPILYGGTNGLVLGLFMIFAIFLGDIVFESLIFIIIVFGLMISIPPIVLSNDEVSFGILFPISFLTFIIPVFGISFGLPNTEIFSLISLNHPFNTSMIIAANNFVFFG